MAERTTKKTLKKADQYDDPKYNYQDYWAGREYEHAAEGIALKRLLRGRHFKHAVDVGGGYGRLSRFLTTFTDKVTLADPPSSRRISLKFILKTLPKVSK